MVIKRGEKMHIYSNLAAEQARKQMTNQEVADYLGICRTTYESKKGLDVFILRK